MGNVLKNASNTCEKDFKTFQLGIPEAKLIHALKKENPGAFEYLYHRYSNALRGAIIRIVNQQETAEDLLQEVFLKIKKNIQSYDPGKGKLFTWMLNLSRHAAIDQLRLASTRGRMRCGEISECQKLIDAASHLQTNTDTIGLKKLLESLSPKEQLILDLVYFKGYSHTEAAEKLAMPLGSVKTCLRNAIIRLRIYFCC